jgi:hypothetical protein
MPPPVPGFIITGELSYSPTGSQWPAVRSVDGQPFVLKVVPVGDVTQAQALATEQMALYARIQSEHLIGQHSAMALPDGTVALVLDEVQGCTLAQLLGARGKLSPGETVTTVAPLLRALADVHALGVVHGHLVPGSVLFTPEGRPLIGDLGVARLMGQQVGQSNGTGTGGFAAPELIGGVTPSPACDVYAMAALAMFCLTGASPDVAVVRSSLTRLLPGTPQRLVEILSDCLAIDPAARPSASAAAIAFFDAAPAETVAMASVSDPAADITRRIRADAASSFDKETRGTRKRRWGPLLVAVLALALTVTLGAGGTWLWRHLPVGIHAAAGGLATAPHTPVTRRPAALPTTTPTAQLKLRPATRLPPTTDRSQGTSTATTQSSTEVLAASGSPRVAPTALLQALVDARALAYAARDSTLLDLVYAPGAKKAELDKGNIATAVKNGGIYLGLSFVVKDVAFLGGRPGTARLRATVVTPAYKTGEPNGRQMGHPREALGPCNFSLTQTPDGWRIADLTTP